MPKMSAEERKEKKKIWSKKWRDKNPNYSKIYYSKPENKEKRRLCQSRYKERNSDILLERHRKEIFKYGMLHKDRCTARGKAFRALKKGILVKPNKCTGCNNEIDGNLLQMHHEDYSKPLNVKWVCKKCHTLIHTENIKWVA